MATLRSVPTPAEDDTADDETMSVLQAANSGTARDLLVAQRNVIAAAVDSPTCAARDLASLTRRLQDIADRLTALDAAEKEASEDEDVPDGDFDAAAV